MVQTDNTTIGNLVAGELMQDLPLNGRDFTSLVDIDAGATNLAGGSQIRLLRETGHFRSG